MLLRGRSLTQPFHGGVICLDRVQQSLYWTGSLRLETWDRELQDKLLHLSKDCRVLLDIGSNVGAMALSVCLRNPGIAAVCVEANSRACALLRRSVALNRLEDRVEVIEAVAGDAEGEIAFDEEGFVLGHVAKGMPGAKLKKSVNFARLVNEQLARGRCLVKIDVEGFEAGLLNQLHDLDRLASLVLVVELHPLGFNGAGDPLACLRSLTESGAAVTYLDGTRVVEWSDPTAREQVVARWTPA